MAQPPHVLLPDGGATDHGFALGVGDEDGRAVPRREHRLGDLDVLGEGVQRQLDGGDLVVGVEQWADDCGPAANERSATLLDRPREPAS